jgi:hypothetical protein
MSGYTLSRGGCFGYAFPAEEIHEVFSVTNVIFCVPLNNYDELRANSRAPAYLPFRLLPPLIRSPIPAQYCMRGSLSLFESIIRPSLARTSNDLFFTKIDVFRDKLTAIGWESLRHIRFYWECPGRGSLRQGWRCIPCRCHIACNTHSDCAPHILG